ncbi:MAG TPA: hypothetical protein VJ323_16920 [Bryobacteraceae bacterium]|jgi:hypothetical protein|nr:hypothetical protein [Bryobacteraceae bacterium]
MKHGVALAWSTGAIVVIALIVLLGMNLTVWAGPNLDIYAEGPKAKVESVFLGEYELGITRLRIVSDDSDSPVVDVQDSHGGIPSVFDLRVGENQIGDSEDTMSRFILKEAKPYKLTLCGNNGWGRNRCSSKPFRLTSP